MRSKRLGIWLIAVAISFFLLILRTSQQGNRVVVLTEDVKISTVTVPPFSTPVPTMKAEDVSCERPYQDLSLWNVPIDWSIAKIHPMNDRMMEAFFADYDWIGSDTSRFTPTYIGYRTRPRLCQYD